MTQQFLFTEPKEIIKRVQCVYCNKSGFAFTIETFSALSLERTFLKCSKCGEENVLGRYNNKVKSGPVKDW